MIVLARRFPTFLAISLLALGCSREPGSDGDSGGDAATDGAEEGGGVAENTFARGIDIEKVEANQAVGIKISEDGEWVGGAGRSAFLLPNRITMIRAFWKFPGAAENEVPSDWVPRKIEGRLHVEWPDGSERDLSDVKQVEETSFVGELGRTFVWGLMADEVVPGMKFQVSLYETESGFEDLEEPKELPQSPRDGVDLIGIEGTKQVLKTIVVPFNYDDGENCKTSPDISEETMQLFQDKIFMMNPIERLEFEVHETLDWDTKLSSFGPLNQFLSGLRADENAPPDVYYYGLIDVCAGGLGEAGGQAYGIPDVPPRQGQAYQRVSSGLSLAPEWASETFVHEVGHSQGRRHVRCNGEEGGADPTYPVEGGDIGEWGFGVLDFKLRHPSFFKDYMTYCNPTWVSTWGWNKVYPVIKEVSTWEDMEEEDSGEGNGRPAAGFGPLLIGTRLPDGETLWHTVDGELPSRNTAPTRVTLTRADGVQDTVEAVVQELADGGGELILSRLPGDFDKVRLVQAHGDRRATPVAKVSIHHRPTLRAAN